MKRRKILATVLTMVILCMSLVPAAFAAGEDTPGYIITGSASGDTYTLEIQVENAYAYTGRIGLVYDKAKVTHQGGDDIDAFNMANDITATTESLSTSALISEDEGYIGTAWYGYGLDALEAPATLATVSFTMKDGVTAADIDASTFRLRVVEEGNPGVWTCSAMLQVRGEELPLIYEYLTDSRGLGVKFEYEGCENVPTNGKTIRLRCANVLEQALAAQVTVGGKVYTAGEDGIIELVLAPGSYQYRAVTDGYGDVNGVLTVSEDAEVPVTFVSDADLVARAASELEIGYNSGDSAQRVSGDIALKQSTDTGVSIAWHSDNGTVITNSGFVFLPDKTGVNVTLTATLTRGSATETKTFSVYVCSEKELRPSYGGSSGGGEDEDVTEPPVNDEKVEVKPVVTPTAVKFTDLAGFDWAKDAIERMAAAGIIKGTSETTFAPGANIKRGDFVLLLMRMFDTDAAADTAFDDVAKDSYYYEAIAQARTLGIAQGTGDNRFNPEAPITRQEMITFVMRALDRTGYLTVSGARDSLDSFYDKHVVADYALDSMSAAVAEGLIVGANGLLNPTGNTTRAEAAVFIARIYDAHNS